LLSPPAFFSFPLIMDPPPRTAFFFVFFGGWGGGTPPLALFSNYRHYFIHFSSNPCVLDISSLDPPFGPCFPISTFTTVFVIRVRNRFFSLELASPGCFDPWGSPYFFFQVGGHQPPVNLATPRAPFSGSRLAFLLKSCLATLTLVDIVSSKKTVFGAGFFEMDFFFVLEDRPTVQRVLRFTKSASLTGSVFQLSRRFTFCARLPQSFLNVRLACSTNHADAPSSFERSVGFFPRTDRRPF